MEENIDFEFHGRDEVLKIINTGGSIVKYLINQNSECPLIGSKIILTKELGRGKQGKAFEIEIKGMGKKNYVAKLMKGKLIKVKIFLKRTKTLLEAANEIGYGRSSLYFNGDLNRMLGPGYHNIYVSLSQEMCKRNKNEYYERFDGNGYTEIPAGSYICHFSEYSEYVIGVLCGELYRKGISANFIDVFGFATCVEKYGDVSIKQYVFMEKIDNSLAKIMKCINKLYTKKEYYNPLLEEVLIIQIFHAIVTYQTHYKLQHNDLHLGNVFIEIIKPETIFNGQNLYEADWFHYKVDDIDIYLPWIPILVKIGDFGLAVKYSEIIVGDEYGLETGYDQEDGNGPWIPNWYCENYDSIFSIGEFYNRTYPSFNGEFVTKIISWMFGSDDKIPNNEWILDQFKNGFRAGNGARPKMDYLSGQFSRGTPKNVLKNKELMEKYLIPPTSGKIVTLGVA